MVVSTSVFGVVDLLQALIVKTKAAASKVMKIDFFMVLGLDG